MKIREAKQKDYPYILDLLKQVHEVHAKGRPDIFVSNGIKYTKKDLKEHLKDPNTVVFVYEDDNKDILGYCFADYCVHEKNSSIHSFTELYIDDLCVDEKHRHEGIGQALFIYTKDYAKSIGCDKLTLRVWELNKDAKKFYKSLGMKTLYTEMESLL